MKRKVEYWLVVKCDGGGLYVISRHEEKADAIKRAERLDDDGMSPPRVYKVEEIRRRKAK